MDVLFEDGDGAWEVRASAIRRMAWLKPSFEAFENIRAYITVAMVYDDSDKINAVSMIRPSALVTQDCEWHQSYVCIAVCSKEDDTDPKIRQAEYNCADQLHRCARQDDANRHTLAHDLLER
jgi:hypothetical protein